MLEAPRGCTEACGTVNDNELTYVVLGTEAWIAALVEATPGAAMVEAVLLADKQISPSSGKLEATSALAESATGSLIADTTAFGTEPAG